jgi:hypothetical protein
MRDESASLRIVVLAVLLPTVAAACVGALVLTGVLHPRIAHMALAGGSILVVAIVAAAISVLGPKYRPTPLLTPLLAGVFAALLATTAVYGAHAHIAPKRAALASVQPPKPVVRPVKTAPVIEKTAIEPELPKAPARSMQPAFDAATFAAPNKAQDQLQAEAKPATSADVQPLPASADDGAAMGGPLVSMANAVVPPAEASEKPPVDHAKKPAVVMAKIPTPVTAPEDAPSPDAPLNLQARFDPTGPSYPDAAGPPMALDGADAAAAATHASIPPLPRIRPCGGAGPACP